MFFYYSDKAREAIRTNEVSPHEVDEAGSDPNWCHLLASQAPGSRRITRIFLGKTLGRTRQSRLLHVVVKYLENEEQLNVITARAVIHEEE